MFIFFRMPEEVVKARRFYSICPPSKGYEHEDKYMSNVNVQRPVRPFWILLNPYKLSPYSRTLYFTLIGFFQII